MTTVASPTQRPSGETSCAGLHLHVIFTEMDMHWSWGISHLHLFLDSKGLAMLSLVACLLAPARHGEQFANSRICLSQQSFSRVMHAITSLNLMVTI